jgi:uncharacterized membrane protein
MDKLLTCILMLAVWFSSLKAPSLVSDIAVVHAVLFYSPSCGHCHLVITETLPPLFERYGEQLYIAGVDVTQPDGQALFLAALQHFHIESGGVPFLVVGDTYLIGSVDIPEKFPGLIEHYLAQGGVDWPAIPGLMEALSTPQPGGTPTTSSSQEEITAMATALITPDTPTPTLPVSTTPESPMLSPTPGLITNSQTVNGRANFAGDPLGNSLAVIVLTGMVVSIVGASIFFRRTPSSYTLRTAINPSWDWLIPVLCLIGLFVAGYLAYVETAQVEAICGPVGDCNSVQQSSYAKLFGVLPIGILGMAGYIMILLTWGIGRSGNQRLANYSHLILLGLTSFGILFSIYLTFIEPFVIGATCAWCLTSAIIMTALFLLSLAPSKVAFFYLVKGKKSPERFSSGVNTRKRIRER